MNGHAGTILRIDLTHKTTELIPTERYEEWGGGHGLAAALFFDLVPDKTIGCFDPRNTLVIAPGLFAGTLVPGSSRAEMVGIQAQSYPQEWFGRSNCGGRFPAMLKYAGYDAVVIEGAADSPTWVHISDASVTFHDATGLWGLNTYDAQKAIAGKIGVTKDGEHPVVLAIGPAGENLSRIASIQHDAGCAFGQGGFGGVWGSKKLKAISMMGTGGVPIADPGGLVDARLWSERIYSYDADMPRVHQWQEFITSHFGGHPNRQWVPFEKSTRRTSGCWNCHLNCKPKTASQLGNSAHCITALFYQDWDLAKHGQVTEISGKAANLLGELGINAFEAYEAVTYLNALHESGVLGKGKHVDTSLPLEDIGELRFVEDLLHRIAYRIEIGDDLAEGLPRAAERWGRLEQDLTSGDLKAPFWGYPIHYDPRTEVYWGYASLLTSRDVNCHDFNVAAFWMPTLDIMNDREPLLTAAEVAEVIAEKAVPYCDPLMIDFSDENLYSIHMARTTAWLLHYSLFWKQSCGLCDNAFADFINPYGPNNRGLTPEGEIRFYQAVTGRDLDFAESLEAGRRILNLDRVIWSLQGRHRDQEVFPPFVYEVDAVGTSYVPGKDPAYYCPVHVNGRWSYKNVVPRRLDRAGVEAFKTLFYELEGWDPESGRPTADTLRSLDLAREAAELDRANSGAAA